jgi:hypothetical protein
MCPLFSDKRNLGTEMLSYCGLVCNTCPIYVATREINKEEQARKRTEIARICHEQYGMKYELSDITDCDGCRTEGGRLFSGCNDCTVRECAKQKALENCAYCSEYICQTLESFFVHDPSAKMRLDEARNKIS